MNYSTAVFLLNSAVRAVICVYEEETRAKPTLFKTFDPDIQINDLVVVPTSTRHGMTVVKVTEVDVTVDFDSQDKINWIVMKVDKEPYEKTVRQETIAIAAIQEADAAEKRRKLRESLMANAGSALQGMAIATTTTDHVFNKDKKW